MKFAIDNGFDYFLNLDADFSHPPRFIPAILAGMAENDVMIGSRYVPGGGVEGEFNLKRKFMSTGINMYARLFLGLRTRDNSGSFRCYRVSKLRQIDLDRVRSRGYSFMEEILYWCRSVGCKFGETPILFENRRVGLLEDQHQGGDQGPPDHLRAGRRPGLQGAEKGRALTSRSHRPGRSRGS